VDDRGRHISDSFCLLCLSPRAFVYARGPRHPLVCIATPSCGEGLWTAADGSMEVTIQVRFFIAIIHPLHRSAISATHVGTLVTTKVPAAFSPTYVVARVPSGTREMAVGGRKQWKITVLLTPDTHTLHTLLTSCPISLPHPILSHRALQETQPPSVRKWPEHIPGLS